MEAARVSRATLVLDGDRLRDQLAELGLSQKQFAERIGLDEARVSNAITGRPLPAETLYRIALGLELAGRRR
jgi:transcriptional regulator with XRE-family HTH domain